MNDEKPEGPRVRVAAIVIKDGEILLVRHSKYGTSYWLLPGGGVHYGETLEEALVRELKEETNLDVVIGRPVLINDSVPPDRHRHVLNIYFTARIAEVFPRRVATRSAAVLPRHSRTSARRVPTRIPGHALPRQRVDRLIRVTGSGRLFGRGSSTFRRPNKEPAGPNPTGSSPFPTSVSLRTD